MARRNLTAGGFLGAAHILRAISNVSRRHLAVLPVLSTMLTPIVPAMPGLKIITRKTVAGRRGETVTYLQNDRKRVEERRQVPQLLRASRPSVGGAFVYVPGPPIVTITRCDLNQTFVLNLDAHEYMSMPIPKPASKEELQDRAAQQPKAIAPSQPTLLIETSTQDTGERKQMFGYMARHVITTVKQTPLVDSGQIPQETVTDGWYIDLDTSISCLKPSSGSFALLVGGTRKPGEPPQMPVLTFKNVGKPETGFAVITKQIHRLTSSSPGVSAQVQNGPVNEMQVTELSTQPLDAALFEVPKNFRKVDQIRRTPVFSYWKRLLAWVAYYWSRWSHAF
jgi:hypothetical protein